MASPSFNRLNLLTAGLRHYWRPHLAVALGTAVATAVLAGALIVGDSVRASLTAMTLDRLGEVDFAMTGPRFVREALADEVIVSLNQPGHEFHAAPAIVLTGAIETTSGESHRRAAGVQVIACDEELWNFLPHGDLAPPAVDAIIVSSRLADQLSVKAGDQVSVLIEIPQTIPRDALLGDREQTVAELLLTISGIADESTAIGRFGLNPSQQLPSNAFVNLQYAQEQLGVSETPKSRSNPVATPARVNSLFLSQEEKPKTGDDAECAAELTSAVNQRMSLEDLHLRIVDHPDRGYVSLESEQMMLDHGIVKAAYRSAVALNRKATPIIVYLLNEIANAKDSAKHSMYGISAGVDFTALQKNLQTPPITVDSIPINGIVINEWLASDLEAAVGDELVAKYHQVGDRGELPEIEQRFQVTAIVPLSPPWDDPGLVPYVPGITDARTFREWRQPFPMKMEAITARDEEYWELHRATPKLFLPLATAQNLWRSRYGEVTSMRVDDVPSQDFETIFLKHLSPDITGFFIQPVKAQGLAAANGTTDFAGLFLGFSFFLIGAAAILIALLFRLSVERRISELGLLTATGWTQKAVRRQALGEAMVVVVAGAAIGLPLAVGYAALMIYGLRTWWNAAVGTQFLFLSVDPVRLIGGAVAAVIIAAISVILGLRSARKISPRAMLSGETEVAPQTASKASWRLWMTPILCGAVAAVLITASLAGAIPARQAFAGFSWQVVSFFLSGALALAAGMTAFSALLRQAPGTETENLALPRLCLRNAARNPRRSAMTAGLVAAAAFLVAAVASGRRNPTAELPDRDSGNGGFLLVGETSTPVLYDLNTEYGRSQLSIDATHAEDWSRLRVVPFRVNPGENASCLNMYQTRLPTILAIPDAAIHRFAKEKRFRFIGASSEDGWATLLKKRDDGVVPVLGDANTLQYSLKKAPGDRVPLDAAPTRQGRELEISGMFDASIFQGVLVMSESNFLELYPERVGFQYFLIESPEVKSSQDAQAVAATISDHLESDLRDYGFDAERVSVRLADFLAVQNTYLSTFQTLGGLGLFLGVFGLFAVMLRNIVERRGELALLRAVGIDDRKTGSLIIGENLLLVGWGLAVGIGAALLAMAPHLMSTGGVPPWGGLALLAAAVLTAGAVAAVVAFRGAVRAPIVASLRNE